jgi:menaquinone-9 beta-reductase
MKYNIIIIGGGLAGLAAGIELARCGRNVLLIERKFYPHHKVCGEYISNEVKPYLASLGLDFASRALPEIHRFQLTSPQGYRLETPLDMGGFGMSRYALDEALYQLALKAGVTFLLNTPATDVQWQNGTFIVTTTETTFEADIVIGAYGKRTRLDKHLGREFMERESPYVGVKYHIRTDFPKNTIALHNFKNGYCGLSAVEENTYCLCYLTERTQLREAGGIPELEKTILYRNPYLKSIFQNSDFLFIKPVVINEVSFAHKECVENHILMAGDSAGLITPLCGNGMAMALRAGHLAARETERYFQQLYSRPELEQSYRKAWRDEFGRRLQTGRLIQSLFGHELVSELAVRFFDRTPRLLRTVIRQTHGREMKVP